MTDKNRDFSQVRVGTEVAFPQTTGEVTAAKGYLVIARGQERFTFSSDTGAVINLNQVWWERTGGYIVSQPEEQPVADQASERMREEHIAALIMELCGPHGPDGIDEKKATAHITEAEKRGEVAGYARRVAEEVRCVFTIPISVAKIIDGAFLPTNPRKMRNCRPDVPAAALAFKAAISAVNEQLKSQPDTRDETIAELRLSEMHARADAEAAKAREAVLREALRNISENKTSDCPDQQIAYLEKLAWAAEHCRRTARNALDATEDE